MDRKNCLMAKLAKGSVRMVRFYCGVERKVQSEMFKYERCGNHWKELSAQVLRTNCPPNSATV